MLGVMVTLSWWFRLAMHGCTGWVYTCEPRLQLV
jgi:hypothetical protein